MSKASRSIAALGAVLFAVIGLAACGGVPGDAVVQINGTPITTSAFEHWMKVASASNTEATPGEKPVVPVPPDYTACIAHLKETTKTAKGQTPPTTEKLKSECETQYKALQSEVLGFLISSQWVLGEGESLGVKLTDKEVEKEFKKIRSEEFPKTAEFEKFLATSGQSVSDLLLRVKLNMLSQKIEKKIIKAKSTVTPAQVEKYYNENKSKYGTPEKRDIRIILTKTEAEALAAKKEIESGKSFASVAKDVSIDPTSKANGGEIKEVVKGEEEKALSEAVFSAPKGVLSGPVKTPFGYYIFEVVSITPGTSEPFAKVKATIKQQLVSTGEQASLTKFTKEFKTKWKSKTVCRTGYLVADCSTYKAPKTTSTATKSAE